MNNNSKTTTAADRATSSPAGHAAQRYVIRRLRRLIPEPTHQLSWLAAQRLAAAQGAALARLAEEADLDPADFIASLPVVRVVNDDNLPDYRTSYWDTQRQQWVIIVRESDGPIRRRFGIAYEFKRILDSGHEGHLYDPRYLHGHVQAEMAADLFTSAVILPARRVRAAVAAGLGIDELAQRFKVTAARVELRLSDLKLYDALTNQPKHPERRDP